MFDEIVDRREALGVIGATGVALMTESGTGRQATGVTKPAFQNFSKSGQELIERILAAADFNGRIAKAEVDQLEKSEGKSSNEIMIELLPVAQLYSLPPISSYRVGVVLGGVSGSLYLGANLELPGQPLGSAVHAEQAACSAAYMYGEAGIRTIAVTAAPCGHCRQFLEELSANGDLEVLVKGKEPLPLKSLLPAAFGPRDLGVTADALPPGRVPIVLSGSSSADDAGLTKAHAAACRSYAPYSKAYAGVAVTTSDGSVYSGSYIENVAFNPSLPPFQIALVSMARARKSYTQIHEVVLVELDNAVISQKASMEGILSSIAPHARLRRVGGRLDG